MKWKILELICGKLRFDESKISVIKSKIEEKPTSLDWKQRKDQKKVTQGQ